MLSTRNRIRIRFAKQAQMRLLGHRDLIRVFERALRRTGLRLSLSQGFHPKARLSFPFALATGMEGTEEVMEVELDEPVGAAQLADVLRPELPRGIELTESMRAPPRPRKARVLRVYYRLPIPEERRRRVEECLGRFQEDPRSPWWVERPGREKPLDARVGLVSIELRHGSLEVTQMALQTAIAGPRDLLRALDLTDLEDEGVWWTRYRVELESGEGGDPDSPGPATPDARRHPIQPPHVSASGDATSNQTKEPTSL